MRVIRNIVLIVMTTMTATWAGAQPLADRVPDDALVYVGWRGAADPGSAYQGSRLKGFLDVSQVPQLTRDVVPKILDKIAQQDRGAAVLREVIGKLGPAFWNSPT